LSIDHSLYLSGLHRLAATYCIDTAGRPGFANVG
jgi:hypothetical protein